MTQKGERAKSIIGIIKNPPQITYADIHIAKIKGQDAIPRNICYRNIETSEIYSYIAGGIAWPGAGSKKQLGQTVPGFAVVVAVDKTEEDEPCIRAVAEVEHEDVYGLVDECVKLRERWGYWEKGGDILREWWGDYERFLTFTGEINDRLQKRDGEGNGFYMVAPIDFDQSNAFEIYLRRIQSCMIPDATGKKTLVLGDCQRLKNYLQNIPVDASKKSVDEYPAIAALGFALHSLKVIEPWKRNIYDMAYDMGGRGIMEMAAMESEREIERLERGDYEDFEDEDDVPGDVIPTIPGG